MKVASKSLITLLVILVYSLGIFGLQQDALQQTFQSSISGALLEKAPSSFSTNLYHQLPDNKTVNSSFLGDQVPPGNDFFGSSIHRLNALGNSTQLSLRHYFLLAQQIPLGLTIRDIIYPFHYHW